MKKWPFAALQKFGNLGSLLPLAAPSTNVRSGPIAIMIGQGMVIGYINATSTRECTFRTGFAAE